MFPKQALSKMQNKEPRREKNAGVTIKHIETAKSALQVQEKLIKSRGKKKENNVKFKVEFALANLEN